MQHIGLQEESSDLITQKVLLSPNNHGCFPTFSVQLCSFLRHSILFIRLALVRNHHQLVFFLRITEEETNPISSQISV